MIKKKCQSEQRKLILHALFTSTDTCVRMCVLLFIYDVCNQVKCYVWEEGKR